VPYSKAKQGHVLQQGILKGEASLYHWPPVWLVWNQLYDYWQFLFFFAKQTNPNQSTGGQWYSDTSPFSIPWLQLYCRIWFVRDEAKLFDLSQGPNSSGPTGRSSLLRITLCGRSCTFHACSGINFAEINPWEGLKGHLKWIFSAPFFYLGQCYKTFYGRKLRSELTPGANVIKLFCP